MRPTITGLYVPGDRPDRFAKAVATGADLVVLDLEDAVAPDRKADARAAVMAWLATGEALSAGCVLQVRVNAAEPADLAALAAAPSSVEARLPKVASIEDVTAAAQALPGRPLTALIESAAGLLRADSIAAHPAVTRVALGEADLLGEIGGGEPLRSHARVTVALAAAAARLPAPMLSVHAAIADLDGLRLDTEAGAACGLVGRMAVHPSQLAVIAAVYRPTDEDLARARAVLAALDEAAWPAWRMAPWWTRPCGGGPSGPSPWPRRPAGPGAEPCPCSPARSSPRSSATRRTSPCSCLRGGDRTRCSSSCTAVPVTTRRGCA